MSDIEIATDSADFDAAVGGGALVIAKFQTKACVVCRRLEPGLKQTLDRTEAALRVIEVDADEITEVAARYGIRAVPTLLLFRNGDELSRCGGFQSVSMLREWLAPHLGG